MCVYIPPPIYIYTGANPTGCSLPAQVEMVRAHAQEVADSVLKNPNVTTEGIATMSEEDKAFLRGRLDLADKVLDRISMAHAGCAGVARGCGLGAGNLKNKIK